MGSIRAVLVVIFALGCVYFTMAMPWAEHNMTATKETVPHTIKLLYLTDPTIKLFDLYAAQKEKHEQELKNKNAEGNLGEYVYALAMAAAMTLAALAIMVVGSEDEVEKTVLPSKN
ncbi:hypothetical protein KA183_09895 [bacterium]|nr:hypothetical protein [bacterium]QQR58575.1 MAG: hypothetical protein IPG59_03500 [Candidatus Melainabacteria bacterium]